MVQQAFIFKFPYLIGLGIFTLFIWSFQLAFIGVMLAVLAILCMLILMKDSTSTLPILFSILFMVSDSQGGISEIPLYIYFVPILLTIGFIVHIIRFKVRIFQGKLMIPFALLFGAVGLSMVHSISIYSFFYLLIGGFFLLLYLFYRNTIQGNRLHYLIQTMLTFGGVVAMQVFIYYLRVENFLSAITTQTVDLGWGTSTTVSSVLIIFIPATFYYAKLTKFNFSWIFMGVFEMVMLLLCFSRGGILTFAFIFILLMIYVFKSKYWRTSLTNFAIIILIATVIIYSNWSLFAAIFDRFRLLLLNDINRITIYEVAFSKFLQHPLLGSGIIFSSNPTHEIVWYYNMILQTLVSFGVVGLLAILYQLYVVFRMIIYQTRPKTIVLGISILGAFILGMIENVYYMPEFMIIFLVIMSVIEMSNKHYDYYMLVEIDARM